MEKRKTKEKYSSKMGDISKENLKIILSMEVEPINGLMAKFTKANGLIIRWVEKGKCYGLMEGFMKETF